MQRKPVHLITRARRLRRQSTDVEALLWSDLRGGRLNGVRFVRQHPIDRFVVDFTCRTHRLIVELDGFQHAGCERDQERTGILNSLGWSVLRFWNEEVLAHRGETLDTILAAVEGRLVAADDPHCLRYSPSPASLRSAPSPASGRGEAPLPVPLEACP